MLLALQVIFFISTLVTIVYWSYFFNFDSSEKTPKQSSEKFISVIICAHNEAENLKKFLPKIIQQHYRNFEIIVVNDRSTDETEKIISSFPEVKCVNIEKTPIEWDAKKWAITQGVSHAQGEYLLLTDADCYPKSEHWISEFNAAFEEKEIVIGVSFYETEKTLLNKFIQFETLLTALCYIGFLKRGIPYMGVGRNIGYKKSIFQQFNFKGIQNLKGGDDDLTFQKLATKENSKAIFSKNSQTLSIPQRTLSTYLSQKRRHLHIGKYYSTKTKSVIGVFNLFSLLFWMSTCLLLIHNTIPYIKVMYLTMLFRTFTIIVTFVKQSNILDCSLRNAGWLFLEPILILFTWIWGGFAQLFKLIKWK